MAHLSVLIAAIALATGVVTQGTKAQGTKAQATKPASGATMLEGTWVITSLNGQTPPDGSPELTLTFAGDKYHQTLGGQVNERGTFKVDAKKKPMTLDLAIAEGSDAGKTQLGIVEVTGETFKAVLDTPGAAQRPADFTPKEGFFMFTAKKRVKV
jgi:uncharacterized protein (TIGR03067 family)